MSPLILEFFQYGLIDWEQSYSCLCVVLVTSDWAVFEHDESAPEQHGTAYPAGCGLVDPGTYILLRTGKVSNDWILECRIFKLPADGNLITMEFTNLASRPRHPTVSNTPPRVRQLPSTMMFSLSASYSNRALSNSHTRLWPLLPHQWSSGWGRWFQLFQHGTHLSTLAWRRGLTIFSFYLGLVDIKFQVGQQRLSEPYHRFHTHQWSRGTYQNWLNPKYNSTSCWFT